MNTKQRIQQIDNAQRELTALKERFVKDEGWHTEHIMEPRGVVAYWCRDEHAVRDIDDVIEMIEGEL